MGPGEQRVQSKQVRSGPVLEKVQAWWFSTKSKRSLSEFLWKQADFVRKKNTHTLIKNYIDKLLTLLGMSLTQLHLPRAVIPRARRWRWWQSETKDV